MSILVGVIGGDAVEARDPLRVFPHSPIALPYFTLPHPPCLTLPHPTLPCPDLPYPLYTLRYPALPYSTSGASVIQVLSRKLNQRYFRGSLYMETDVEVGSSVAAESVVSTLSTGAP